MAQGYKTGGRKKGTLNLVSGTSKEIISQVINKELQKLPSLLSQMETKEKVDCIIRLLPYILPRISPVEESITRPERSLKELMESMTKDDFSNNKNFNFGRMSNEY